ncbi:sigma factor-like helix-turn-helix DNA-binding protein [Streptomyces polygonati]|uniref:Sigma factor-like helix-turn-helix DNA-binding protein n=1 Tax=Streptomyces polygonati TaxID=1617087 RepID=A0ABV8HU00_9ACTN
MTRTEEFEELRPLLFSIAYRIVGSAGEAEDAVRETWLRYEMSASRPVPARAFLSAVVTRVSIDVLRSARLRRAGHQEHQEHQEYGGPRSPDPLPAAALPLLDRLSPLERAVFVLREVFGFGFPEIAAAVGRPEEACRGLAVRARRHMAAGGRPLKADGEEREKLAERFFDAFRAGDIDGLRDLLATDVRLVDDGGGTAPRPAGYVTGPEHAARALAALHPLLTGAGVAAEPHEVDGRPGAVFHHPDGQVLGALVLDILDGRVRTVRTLVHPGGPGRGGPVADARAGDRGADRG